MIIPHKRRGVQYKISPRVPHWLGSALWLCVKASETFMVTLNLYYHSVHVFFKHVHSVERLWCWSVSPSFCYSHSKTGNSSSWAPLCSVHMCGLMWDISTWDGLTENLAQTSMTPVKITWRFSDFIHNFISAKHQHGDIASGISVDFRFLIIDRIKPLWLIIIAVYSVCIYRKKILFKLHSLTNWCPLMAMKVNTQQAASKRIYVVLTSDGS